MPETNPDNRQQRCHPSYLFMGAGRVALAPPPDHSEPETRLAPIPHFEDYTRQAPQAPTPDQLIDGQGEN